MKEELTCAQVVPQTAEALLLSTSQTHPQATQPLLGNFIPPRLTKQGKVAVITRDGFGGSLPFP